MLIKYPIMMIDDDDSFLTKLSLLVNRVHVAIIIPPANFVCGGYTVFTLSVRPCVRPCVRP